MTKTMFSQNKQFSLQVIILLLTLSYRSEYYFPNTNKGTIIFIFHGFGDTCDKINLYWRPQMMAEDSFQNVICVESGDGATSVLSNMNDQVTKAAVHINSIYENGEYTELFKKGVYFLGLSQGGIIARIVFNQYPGISNYVRRIITFGTPHSGVDHVAGALEGGLPGFLDWLVKTSFGSWLSSAGFYVGSSDIDLTFGQLSSDNPFFTLNCNFDFETVRGLINTSQTITVTMKNKIEELIQECGEIRSRYNRLEMFVAVGYVQDKMVQPIISQIFGANFLKLNMHNQEMYAQSAKVEIQNKIQKKKNDVIIINYKPYFQKNYNSQGMSLKDRNQMQSDIITRANLNKSIEYLKSIEDLIQDDVEQIQGTIERAEINYDFYAPSNLKTTDIYVNNALNFENLYQSNRLLMCSINANHLETTPGEIAMIAVRLFGLPTPKTLNRINQIQIPQNTPFMRSELLQGLRMYCDMGCLTYPKVNYRLLVI